MVMCVCSTLCTDFGGSGEEVEVVEVQEYVGDPAYGTATTQLQDIHIMHAHCRLYTVYTCTCMIDMYDCVCIYI